MFCDLRNSSPRRRNIASLAGYRRSTGIFPRKRCRITRNAAETRLAPPRGLALATVTFSVTHVVAGFPQGPGTFCLNRYPSPNGRRHAWLRASPTFCLKTKSYMDRRGPAQFPLVCADCFDVKDQIALFGGTIPFHKTRGTNRCGHIFSKSLPDLRSLDWQPAATRLANKSSLGRVQVWARQPYWTVTSQLAQLSARPVTSPIVRHSRIAAADLTHTSGCAIPNYVTTVRGNPVGGQIVSAPGRTLSGQISKGT